MKQVRTQMSISELSAQSTIPVSTIKFYIRKGLLAGPVTTGRTRGYYTLSHLNRLNLIQKLKEDGTMTLDKIRETLQVIDQQGESEKAEDSKSLSIQWSDIIESAIGLFREKGYEAVTIADVIKAAGIGKSTFYRHFQNKKDLFLGCIETVLLKESASLGISGMDDEKDILKVFDKFAELFYNVNPLWQDVINMLRSAATYNPVEFAPKLEEVIQLKIQRYRQRIGKGIQRGIIRDLNAELLGVMVMGIEEYCSGYIDFLLKNNQNKETQRKKMLEQVKDIILYGVLKR
jgi:AcrR family transcriptional regulator